MLPTIFILFLEINSQSINGTFKEDLENYLNARRRQETLKLPLPENVNLNCHNRPFADLGWVQDDDERAIRNKLKTLFLNFLLKNIKEATDESNNSNPPFSCFFISKKLSTNRVKSKKLGHSRFRLKLMI